MLDATSFKEHLTGLVEQSTSPVSVSATLNNQRFLIAYSGGLDSHVLLHLMHSCGLNIRAIYIEHGLQQASKPWAEHCANVCAALNIPFESISVNAQADKGESPEASARTARYQALAEQIKTDEILLTAQHLQDQSETLLLQMLRTSGPAGLAAMPVCKSFADSLHMRPLLTTDRRQLEAYAKQHQLQWVEDPSNEDQRYDRNFFRQSIFPLLKKRWPSIHQTLSNVCGLQAEASELINELAAIDAKTSIDGNTLTINELRKLSTVRQKNLIRYWLQQCGLDAPTAKRLKEILGSMVTAADDKMPMVNWGDTEVRRFQGKLYAMKTLQAFDANQVIVWNPKEKLCLSQPACELSLIETKVGLSAELIPAVISIRFRTGGERIKPIGRAHTMDLKKLMQEAAVPPWKRSRIPLLYLDDQLIAIAGYWIADDFKNSSDKPAFEIIHKEIN